MATRIPPPANNISTNAVARNAATTPVDRTADATPDTAPNAATGDATVQTPAPRAGIDAATFGQTAAASALGQLQAQQFNPKENLFGLIPGRTKGAVGLDVVLKGLSKSPQSKTLVNQVVATMEAQTGVKVPKALVSAAIANPERLSDILRLSPQQMSAGVAALQKNHEAGNVAAVPPRPLLLPKAFDFKNLDQVAYTRPEAAPKEIAPGLFRGGFKNPAVDDAKAKANTVMAEVFDRLSDNANLAPKDRFEVTFEGSTFTRVDTFLGKLRDAGYTVNATVEHRVANFAELLTKAPDGSFLDVPTPLMVDVDLDNGKSAAVPSIHSEVVFDIQPPAGETDPLVPASNIKWYQGVSATGFFPADVNKTPEWTGKTVTDTFTGDKADKALELAGLMGDVINQAAKDQGLYASGYGLTGVCNDSVAVIEMALTGRATSYPLLMQDALLKPELEKRLGDKNHRDDPDYKMLLDAIDQLPSDVSPNASRLDRALTSIPWAAGEEPFHSTESARQALLDVGANPI